MTHALRKQLAAMLGMPPDDVRCIYIEGSGCYGRNGHEDAAADAALLASAVGRPVRVQWSRADEHGWDPKGPPTLIDLRRPSTPEGNVVAWDSEFFIPEGAGRQRAARGGDLAGLPHETDHRAGQHHPELGAPLRVSEHRTVCHRLAETPFRPPGSARRDGCRTPSPTRPSWTSSRRRRASIRSTSA